MRRLRAETIADRSKVLNPLHQRIEEIEQAIIRFEEQLKQDNLALMRAVRTGEGKSVSFLSVSIHQIKKTIESLFEELEGLTTTYHAKSGEFEEKLNNLL
jgi:ATP-binding cassette subfamily F protein 3